MFCIIETFIGKEVLEEYPEFVTEYYKWHDIMEEAAALSVIFPKFLARPGPSAQRSSSIIAINLM
jgi:hypothetical protein